MNRQDAKSDQAVEASRAIAATLLGLRLQDFDLG